MRRFILTSAAFVTVLAPLVAQQTPPARPAPKPEPDAPAAAAPPAASAPDPSGLKSRQSTVYGLLVMDLGEGKLAGQASQMNCTATQGGTEPAVIKFNQNVGKEMDGALNEVRKYMEVRHNGWPKGWKIEMSFEDRYTPKDGPSAAVACALMVDSLITGAPLMDKTAITGDLTAAGTVQPVGGVPDKLRAAVAKQCTVACIPVKNGRSMADHILLKGVRPVTAIQIFVTEKFDDAKKVAASPRDPAITQAITEFADIARVLNANTNPAAAVRHPKVVERLKSVLRNAPNHLSAKLLLDLAEGRGAKVLSAAGSLEAIQSESAALLAGLRAGDPGKLGKDKVADAVSALSNLRPRLDKRTHAYADALLDFGRAFRQYTTGSDQPETRTDAVKALNDLGAKGNRVKAEFDKLRSDQLLMETVMQE